MTDKIPAAPLTDEELAAALEVHAASLDRLGMRGPAVDIRLAAARLRDDPEYLENLPI